MIQGVSDVHARVDGETPKGEAYKALDPELLDWVSATAAYGFLNAYDRFVAKVSEADQSLFWREGAPVAKLYGVQHSPTSNADFLAMMNKLAPRFEPHPIVGEFLGIIQSGQAAPGAPKALHRALARASVSLLPPLVRDRLQLGREYDLTLFDKLALRAAGAVAERTPDLEGPPCQASVRLGLPATFLYQSRAARPGCWPRPACPRRMRRWRSPEVTSPPRRRRQGGRGAAGRGTDPRRRTGVDQAGKRRLAPIDRSGGWRRRPHAPPRG